MPRSPTPPIVVAASLAAALVTGVAAPAAADLPRLLPRPQLQVDGGLTVIGPAYEHPLAEHWAVAGEAFVFGTYFLPWFDLGDDTIGVGAGVRATWLADPSGRGLYVTPYLRAAAVRAQDDDAGGLAITAGVFVGWAIGLTDRLDLRLGLGAQYLRVAVDPEAGPERVSSTPFPAIDATLGWRL